MVVHDIFGYAYSCIVRTIMGNKRYKRSPLMAESKKEEPDQKAKHKKLFLLQKLCIALSSFFTG